MDTKIYFKIIIFMACAVPAYSAHAYIDLLFESETQRAYRQNMRAAENKSTIDPTDYSMDRLQNYNEQTIVQSPKIVKVIGESALIKIIQKANEKGKKLKALGKQHSTNSLIMSASTDNSVFPSPYAGSGVYLDLSYFAGMNEPEQRADGRYSVKVGAATKLGDLADFLHEKGYSLGFAFPAYKGLSIGGLIATGAHGSSRVHNAVSSQSILSLRLVDGQGRVRVLSKTSSPDIFRAAISHLGLLGVVTEVEIEIEPDFNLQMNVTAHKDWSLSFFRFSIKHIADYEAVVWSPVHDEVVHFQGFKTDQKPSLGGHNLRLGDNNINGISDWLTKCVLRLGQTYSCINSFAERFRIRKLSTAPPFALVEDGKVRPKNNVIGYSKDMLLSKYEELSAAYSHSEWQFAFPISRANEVLSVVRSHALKHHLHFPITGGLFMRFAKAAGEDGAWLSHIEGPDSKKGEVWVLADFADFREFNDDVHLKRNESRDGLLKALLNNPHVRWHWGKNSDQIMSKLDLKAQYGPNLDRFLNIRRELDPNDVFGNDLLDALLNGQAGHSNAKFKGQNCNAYLQNELAEPAE